MGFLDGFRRRRLSAEEARKLAFEAAAKGDGLALARLVDDNEALILEDERPFLRAGLGASK